MPTVAIPPILFRWDGEAMVPLTGWVADKYYVIGETYRLVIHEDRSEASHRHFFVCVNEAFAQLPAQYASRFANPDALRKFALIQGGYCDTRSIVCANKAEASRVAAFVSPFDTDAVVIVHDALVQVLTAQSQSYRAMGKDRFAESKSKVLTVLAEMLGVTEETLTENAGRSA